MPNLTIDTRFTTRVQRSPRVLEVAEAFGLGLDDKEFVVFDQLQLTVNLGDVVYVTGQSGAGKSVLLREIARQLGEEHELSVANIDAVELNPDKPIIDQIGKDTSDALRYLSTVGINDAYLYLRRPGELSDGQRYRFKLAKVIESGARVWVADEFCAVLDRTTAKVIAFALQKLARQQWAILLVATTHTDLVGDLHPSLVVEKRFREKVRIETREQVLKRITSKPMTQGEVYSLLSKGLA